jgi:hypothetical protein
MRTQVFGSSVTPSRGWCTATITMPGVNRTGNGIFGSCARARRPPSAASGASAAARWGRRRDPRRSGNSRSEVFAPLDRPWRRAPVWPSGGEVPVCPRGDGRLAPGAWRARRRRRVSSRISPVLVRSHVIRPCTDPVGTKRRQTTGSSWISTDISPKSVGKCRRTRSGSAALMFCNIPSAASAASRPCGDEGSTTEWCHA